jgi:hypothetical protein
MYTVVQIKNVFCTADIYLFIFLLHNVQFMITNKLTEGSHVFGYIVLCQKTRKGCTTFETLKEKKQQRTWKFSLCTTKLGSHEHAKFEGPSMIICHKENYKPQC